MTGKLTAIIPGPDSNGETFVEPRRQDPIYQVLRELGVSKLYINYSGSGDSGCIDGIQAFDEKDQSVTLPDREVPVTLTQTEWDPRTMQYSATVRTVEPMPLRKAVEQWCYDLLEEHFPGWEINEGSDGAIEIEPFARKGEISHNWYVPETHVRSFQ